MPIRDLTILFQIRDKVSSILNPILDRVDAIDGSNIDIGINMDPGQAAAQASAFESSLDSLQTANERVSKSLEKVAGEEKKEGKEAEASGKKTKEAGEGAKQASTHWQNLQKSVEGASQKFKDAKEHLDGVKTKLLAVQAAITGLAAISVMSSAKTESLVDELNTIKGEKFAAPIIEWANEGKGKAWSGKTQRLEIGADLSEMGYNPDDIKKYGTEIEKYFFQKGSMLKRQGVGGAEELARTLAAAEKMGSSRGVEKLFSSGALSEDKLSKETERLRVNYEKFAFATDEVVKKEAMHNLIMKELTKTNKSFTGEAVTLEQKLDVLSGKWSSFLGGIGDKLRPAATMLVDALITVMDTIESIPGHDAIFIFLGLLVTAITTLVSWVLILAPALEFLTWLLGAGGVGGAAASLGGFLTTLGGILGSITGVIGTVASGIGALIAGIVSIPALPVIAAILAIAAALYLIYTRTTILQDGFAMLQGIIARALAAAQKAFSTVTGGLRGNKSDILEIGTWVRNFLEGLVPGWLSDIFATAQNIYREAMRWFDKIMGWWNSFLKKVGEVYDKVKAFFGLGGGEEEQAVTPDMQKYGVLGYGTINDEKAVKLAYRELAGDIGPDDPIYDQIKEATGGKTRLYGKDYNDLLQSHPELAAKFTKTGETLVKADEVGDYGVPDSALPPEEDSSPLALPDIPAAVEERVQEAGDTYVEDSAKNYEEKKAETGSETAAAMSSYDPIGFYKNLIFGSGEEKTDGSEGEGEKLPAGAVGATVDGSGAMIVHEDEELVPARITSGAGKLASLLGAALDFMGGRSDIEREITERMTSQQTSSREISAGFGPVTVHVSIQAPVTVQITREMDLSKLDVNHLIDWSRAAYELEKVLKSTFRFQEG